MQSSGKYANSSYSPSFNSYFNANLTEIAARTTAEFADADDSNEFTVGDSIRNEIDGDDGGAPEINCEEDGLSDEFEFDLSNLINGEIRPVYPVFDRDLLRDFCLVEEIESRPSDPEEESSRAQAQLKDLFLEDRDPASSSASSASSEADELEEVPTGTYCVWAPDKSPAASPSPGRCTKSNSTGSSVSVAVKAKTWKLRDFLKRSKSDGKEGLMLLAPKKKMEAPAVRGSNSNTPASSAGDAGKPVRARAAKTTAGREGYYGGAWSREGGENKRRSYLPYKQDLVGLFASPQGLRKMHLPPSR